ncbi:DEAD/DEAH box helicase (plasmid) [Paenibacillus sp. EC2-1]|uniref:DEAD/DEAH box helicase n=1 Tax=Paenibacillus sp. EC2-1 TaxID=3388665 RepID=UPI003BEF0E28
MDRRDDDLIEVKTPYHEPYIKRLRKIDGATWGGDEDPMWLLPIESAEDLDEEFRGELIYVTPRHELLEIKPPKPPKILKEVPRVDIQGIKLPPRDFQAFGANFLAYCLKETKIAILGDLMGTGKTMQCIMTAMQLKQEKRVRKALVVVLAPLRIQWTQEIRKFTDEDSMLFADFKAKYSKKGGKSKVVKTIDDQKKEFINEFVNSDKMFMVMSYQGFQQNTAMLEKAGFDMIIFDEAHYLANKDAKTNKAAKNFIAKRTKKHRRGAYPGIKYSLYASGTMITSYPDQIFGLVRTGNEKLLGTYRDFKNKFLEFNNYDDIVGYKNLDRLRKLIHSFTIRRTDKEIQMSLPKIVEDDIYIEPHPKQVKIDKELRDYQKELIDQKNNLLRSGRKDEAEVLEQKMKGISMQRRMASNHPNLFQMSANEKTRERYEKFQVKELDCPKFARCIEMVREIVENGHKVVIFTESRRMTAMLHKHIKTFTKAVRYIGGLSDKVRERRKQKFNNSPACKVMIANSAGSTGLNLQAGRYLINYDLPDTPAMWEQRKYRIRRLDSKFDRVFIYNLINEDLVDQQTYDKLKNKQDSFNAIIENDASQTEFHKKMVKKKGARKRAKSV